jgi:predicted HAD superfamily Cof-like phosphohydrolase
MDMNHLLFLEEVVTADVEQIKAKEETYKGSWKKRGGTGTFMMLARKWDRIENMLEAEGYDIFDVIANQDFSTADGKLRAELNDLRTYLTLVEAELRSIALDNPTDEESLSVHFRSHFNRVEEQERKHELEAIRERMADSGIAGIPEEEELSANKPKNTSDHYQRVFSFMEGIGQHIPEGPQVPPDHVKETRIALHLEETFELINALGYNIRFNGGDTSYELSKDNPADLIEIADACADIAVINTGTMISCGLPDKPLLEEVDRANLNKIVRPDCKKCGNSYSKLLRGKGKRKGLLSCSKCGTLTPGGYFREGKWIKPANFVEPNFNELVDQLISEQKND